MLTLVLQQKTCCIKENPFLKKKIISKTGRLLSLKRRLKFKKQERIRPSKMGWAGGDEHCILFLGFGVYSAPAPQFHSGPSAAVRQYILAFSAKCSFGNMEG